VANEPSVEPVSTPQQHPHATHDLEGDLRDDLFRAELDTPPHEETPEEVKRALHRRALRIGGGILLLLLAAAVMPIPGPGGIVFLLAGLRLLAEDIPFAHRLLENIKERTQDESGGTSKWVWILGGCGLVASVTFSVWFYVLR
jgi:hypothetical protein